MKKRLGGRSKPALEWEGQEKEEDKEAHRTPEGNGFPGTIAPSVTEVTPSDCPSSHGKVTVVC